ncbi:MAG: hypothetical protein HY226_00880 [Candidatus Vogelbacteria bacterium]|nr:hypothetical protein [Candidatus Vogelbacteria bacterium]
MADKGPVFSPVNDLKAAIFLVVLFWIFWVYSGGPQKYEASQKVLLQPSWPLSTGESYGDISKTNSPSNISTTSPAESVEKPVVAPKIIPKPQLITLSKGNVVTTERGYVILDFPDSNDSPLNLHGATMRGLFGPVVDVGLASQLPEQGKINSESYITMPAASRAYIIYGESPIGNSFRVNKCFGYLTQYQTYYPPVIVSCPECQSTKVEDQNYNSCVRDHRNDPDFFKNEWHIYLNNVDRVWNETGDIIRIFDKDGKSIASMIY